MGSPNLLVPLALLLYAGAVAWLFSSREPRSALLLGLFGGWLFLPHFDYRYAFFLSTKSAFVPAVLLLASLAFDPQRWRGLRLGWADLPMMVLCAAPAATALTNDLGLNEAIASARDATLTWGAPYLLGRVYLGAARDLRRLASTLAAAALVYAPLCLWEVRMSPMLHFRTYGFTSFGFDQVIRFGGYRPAVFMEHGLALGMFVVSGTLAAYWLWRCRPGERIGGLKPGTATLALVITSLLTRSTGALALLAFGVAILEGSRFLRTPALLLLLVAIPPAYTAARVRGWAAEELVEATQKHLDAQRAESIQFRFANERRLIEKAMQQPWLGWGRFGRSFVYADDGTTPLICDSLWIITAGVDGLVGLVALGAYLLLPIARLARRIPRGRWGAPDLAAPVACATLLGLWAIDDLLNAMLNPMFPVMAGALATFLAGRAAVRAARPARLAARVAVPHAPARAA